MLLVAFLPWKCPHLPFAKNMVKNNISIWCVLLPPLGGEGVKIEVEMLLLTIVLTRHEPTPHDLMCRTP